MLRAEQKQPEAYMLTPWSVIDFQQTALGCGVTASKPWLELLSAQKMTQA